MVSVAASLLDLDVAVNRLLRGRKSMATEETRAAVRAVRRQSAVLALAACALTPVRKDPLAAVREVLELARAAGLPWQDIAAMVNRLGESPALTRGGQ